jgi:tetratricopeptide (TPR) repeat protein
MTAGEFPDEATLDAWEFDLSGQERIDTFGAHAATMEVGASGRAELLTMQAEFLAQDRQLDEARTAFAAALEDGGWTTLHPKVGLAVLALEQGDEAEADALLAELLTLYRDDQLDPDACAEVGEALEKAGRLKQAHRWFTMPLRELDAEELEEGDLSLLSGRYRVRRALGLPMDVFDEETDALREEYEDDEPV